MRVQSLPSWMCPSYAVDEPHNTTILWIPRVLIGCFQRSLGCFWTQLDDSGCKAWNSPEGQSDSVVRRLSCQYPLIR